MPNDTASKKNLKIRSGDITDVGDCSSGACFTAAGTGTNLVFKNATSGSVTVQTVAGALGTPTISLPATTGTVITTGDTGTVTNTMLSGSIAASKLVGTDIATVGTITSGIWNAGAVTSSGAIQGTTLTATAAGGLTLQSLETITNATDGRITFATDTANAPPAGDASVPTATRSPGKLI